MLAGAVGTGVVLATRTAVHRHPVPSTVACSSRSTTRSTPSTAASARVDAAVFNRKVLLVGEANNANTWAAGGAVREEPAQCAQVINELEGVASTPGFMARSNDAYLTSSVKTFLVTAEGVPANSVIKVTTDKSVVYLMGVVTAAEGDRATDVARNASGVQKVVKAFDYTITMARQHVDERDPSDYYGSPLRNRAALLTLAVPPKPAAARRLTEVTNLVGERMASRIDDTTTQEQAWLVVWPPAR